MYMHIQHGHESQWKDDPDSYEVGNSIYYYVQDRDRVQIMDEEFDVLIDLPATANDLECEAAIKGWHYGYKTGKRTGELSKAAEVRKAIGL